MIESASGLIGFVDSLENLHEILTDERQQEKIFDLCEEFGGWRRCKGDGNCFYRAAGFALVEAALCSGEPQQLRDLNGRLQRAAGGEATDLVVLLSELPAEQPRGRASVAIEMWYEALLCNPALDTQLACTVRRATASWLEEHRNRKFNGMAISTFVQSVHDMSLDDFIQLEVLANGREAEQLMIHAAMHALGTKIEIIQVDRTDGPAQRYHLPDEAASSRSDLSATLLFRPGHYDIFYRRSLFTEVSRLQEELSLRRLCGKREGHTMSDDDVFNPFPGRTRPIGSSGIDSDMYQSPARRTISGDSQTTRIGFAGGSLEDCVADLHTSLSRCVAAVDHEKEGLAARRRRLEADRTAARKLRQEVEALKSQVAKEAEELRRQQEALSAAQAAKQSGFWALCVCPGPPSSPQAAVPST